LNIEPLKDKILAFNWNVVKISGHDVDEIEKAVKDALNNVEEKPTCILLKTVKGKGVSIFESPGWHAKAPNEEEYKKALQELK
jgi:transketolase